MSDVGAAVETPALETPADYKALYEAEAVKTADLVKQRNFLRPAQRMLEGLDPDARDALIELGQAAAKGDTDAIAAWAEATLQDATGKDIAALAAERVKASTNTEPDKPEPGMTAAEIARIASEAARNAYSEAKQSQDVHAKVSDEMKTLGFPLSSAAGKVILQHAVDNMLTLEEAAGWYTQDTNSSLIERQRAAAAVGEQVPGKAPNGNPPGTAPDRQANESDIDYGRRRALARLTANRSTTA